MKVVQELVAYFDRRGKLSRRQLRRLLEQNQVASDAPTSMHGLCETVGATYYFRVTGVTEGQLWGTDIYSGDSTIGATSTGCAACACFSLFCNCSFNSTSSLRGRSWSMRDSDFCQDCCA